MFISCKQKTAESEIRDPNTTPTQISHNLKVIYSVNGEKSYSFKTPLLERYEMAEEPFMEFTEGVYLESYKEGSSDTIENTLVADYAKLMEKENLWEARGNVVATNANGQILKTEQLFWNQTTRRIYSNIKTTIIDGDDVIIGENGFESDEQFGDMLLKRTKGRIEVDPSPTTAVDSAAVASPADSVQLPTPEFSDQDNTADARSVKKQIKRVDATAEQ